MSVKRLPGKSENELTLIISGREIVVESAQFVKSIDTCADGVVATAPWIPGADPEFDKITAPFSFSSADLYIGGKLQFAGKLYDVEQERTQSGTLKNLSMWSKTADIIDSTVLSPYEASNITLTDRCKQQCRRFAIDVVVAPGVDLTASRKVQVDYVEQKEIVDGYQFDGLGVPDDTFSAVFQKSLNFKTKTIDVWKTKTVTVRDEFRFPRVNAERTDKIFDHLSALASQRGLLLSCTKYGDLLIVQPNTADEPVGTLTEESGIVSEWRINFSGRSRFGSYRAIANSASQRRTTAESESVDKAVSSLRFLTFRAPDVFPGEAPSAAAWRRNKSAADALSMPLPVNTWYAPNGELWTPNTQVTVVSPAIGIKKGFTFLISRVEFDYSSAGAVATLHLKPPSVYTLEEIEEPWL